MMKMRYFSINYVAKVYDSTGSMKSVVPIADEFMMISEKFPNRKDIIDTIKREYPDGVVSIDITHKFEFKSSEDFIDYFLSRKAFLLQNYQLLLGCVHTLN